MMQETLSAAVPIINISKHDRRLLAAEALEKLPEARESARSFDFVCPQRLMIANIIGILFRNVSHSSSIRLLRYSCSSSYRKPSLSHSVGRLTRTRPASCRSRILYRVCARADACMLSCNRSAPARTAASCLGEFEFLVSAVHPQESVLNTLDDLVIVGASKVAEEVNHAGHCR